MLGPSRPLVKVFFQLFLQVSLEGDISHRHGAVRQGVRICVPAAKASRWYDAHMCPSAESPDAAPPIVLVRERIEPSELARLENLFFEEMVKYVVDVHRGVVAVGGELHADAESLLIEDGSRQADLWGANYYRRRGREECIEYTSLINIRPAHGNRSMFVEDPSLRERIREWTFRLLGEGESPK